MYYIIARISSRRRRHNTRTDQQRPDERKRKRLQLVVQWTRVLRGNARDAETLEEAGSHQHDIAAVYAQIRPNRKC